MKKILLLAAFFASATAAWACPDLSGSYTCQPDKDDEDQRPYTETISQKTENNVTTYTISDSNDPSVSQVIADGVARETRDEEKDENGEVTVTVITMSFACEGSAVNGKFNMSFEPNPYQITAFGTLVASLTDAGDLKTKSNSTTKQGENVINDETTESVCTRNNR